MGKPDILQVGELPEWDQTPLETVFKVHRYFEASDKVRFIQEVGSNVHAIATRGDLGTNRAMIEARPRLELISVYGVGFDGVDLEACKERAIPVTNRPDVLTNEVADLWVLLWMRKLCCMRWTRGVSVQLRWTYSRVSLI